LESNEDCIEKAKGHLAQLRGLGHDATEVALTVASGSLRILLVGGLLQDAWGRTGIKTSIIVPTRNIIAPLADGIVAYCGGGDLLPGVSFATNLGGVRTEEVSLRLSKFKSNPRVRVGARRISTVNVVSYFANTRGGTHYDPELKSARAKQRAVFETLRRLEHGEIRGPSISKVNGRNLLHHELLSIAQDLLKSKQVAALLPRNAPGQ
jgi:hypothetical protein